MVHLGSMDRLSWDPTAHHCIYQKPGELACIVGQEDYMIVELEPGTEAVEPGIEAVETGTEDLVDKMEQKHVG